MAVRLFARGSDGVVAITKGGVTDAVHTDYLDNPFKNIDDIHFHSGFEYMSMVATYTGTVTFPARAKSTATKSGGLFKGDTTYAVPQTGSDRYEIGTHDLGYVPFATATRGTAGSQVTPTLPLQDSGSAMRVINVEMDTTKIYIHESWMTYTSGLDSITETFTVWVFRNPQ